MKFLLNILLFILIGISISSCDKEHIKGYYIQNELTSSIQVNFRIEEVQDSMIVEANMNELVHSHSYFYGTVGVDDDRYEDVISNIVVQIDTVTIELDESLWQYEKVDKYYA